jgi:hypothetical protein
MAGSFRWVLLASLALVACEQNGASSDAEAGDNEILPATESFKAFGDYVVHFNAIPTVDLNSRIADENDIVRSPNRIMLLINVRQGTADGLDEAVPAAVTASANNLSGQLRTLNTQEIREETTLYYVAETQVQNGETLIFTVEATPEGTTEPLIVKFRKQFFVDK